MKTVILVAMLFNLFLAGINAILVIHEVGGPINLLGSLVSAFAAGVCYQVLMLLRRH